MPYAMDLDSSIPARTSRPLLAKGLRALAVLLIGGCAVAAWAPCAWAKASKDKPHKENKRMDSREIEGLESQWRDAMIRSDMPALEKLLAEDFLAISASGTLSDKQQYLHRMESRQNQFSQIDLMDMKVRILPGTAVVTSQVRVTGQLESRPISGVFRYTKVYRRNASGQWLVLNFEATRVSGPHADEMDMQRGQPLEGHALR
jgi:ketosteroid isomerase-like protein